MSSRRWCAGRGACAPAGCADLLDPALDGCAGARYVTNRAVCDAARHTFPRVRDVGSTILSSADALRQDAHRVDTRPSPHRCASRRGGVGVRCGVRRRRGVRRRGDRGRRVDPSDVGAYRAAVSSSAAASVRRSGPTPTTRCARRRRRWPAGCCPLQRVRHGTQRDPGVRRAPGQGPRRRGRLDRGVEEIRGALRPATSEAVRSAATTLADRSGALCRSGPCEGSRRTEHGVGRLPAGTRRAVGHMPSVRGRCRRGLLRRPHRRSARRLSPRRGERRSTRRIGTVSRLACWPDNTVVWSQPSDLSGGRTTGADRGGLPVVAAHDNRAEALGFSSGMVVQELGWARTPTTTCARTSRSSSAAICSTRTRRGHGRRHPLVARVRR